MAERERFWIIDTASITEVRRTVPRAQRNSVYEALDKLVQDGVLVYPVQVVAELGRFHDPESAEPDLPYEWVRRNQEMATRHGSQFEKVKQVLAHPQVRRVVDAEKTTEEADAYVLGLALHLKDGGAEVTVLTQETTDTPNKLSMNSACGLLRLVCLRMGPFLAQQGIWPSPP